MMEAKNGKPAIDPVLLSRQVANQEIRTMLAGRFLQQGFDTRRNINHECGYPETGAVTAELLHALYEREPIADRVVNLFPRECWKMQPLVYEKEKTEATTPFEISWDELGKSLRGVGWNKQECGSTVYEYLERLDVQCGIGSYGVLLLGYDDGLDMSLPVKGVIESGSAPASKETPYPQANQVYRLTTNAAAINGRQLLYLRVFPQALAAIAQWENNFTSPRYGQPVMYSLTFHDPNTTVSDTATTPTGSTRQVHWTRVLHVADNLASSEVLGVSRMLPVLNALLDCQKIRAADGEGYWKNAFAQLFLEMLPEFADLTKDENSLKDMMEKMQNGLQRWGAMEGFTVKSVPPVIVDPTPHYDVQLRAICIKLGVPQRVFEGSERGELASSQDADSWESRLKGRRHSFIKPRIIEAFVNRLIMTGVLAEPGEDGFTVEWPEIDTVTPTEKAQIALVKTQALTNYVSGGGEQLVAPIDYLTRFLSFTDEEAQAILDESVAHMEEQDQLDMEKQQEKIDAGLAPDPTAQSPALPIKMKDGEKLVAPDGKPLPGAK